MRRTTLHIDHNQPGDLISIQQNVTSSMVIPRTQQSEKSHKTDERGDKRDNRSNMSGNDVRSPMSRPKFSQQNS